MADLHARLAQATGFEWDAGNVRESWTKHVVGKGECEQVFFNAPLVLAADPAHSTDESRFFALGQADGGPSAADRLHPPRRASPRRLCSADEPA